MRLPLFIEVPQSAEHANAMVCRKVMAELFRQKIAPLPFAANIKEARDVISSLRSRGQAPAVFIINTFGAGELLQQIDSLIGTTPTLFFYRRIFSEPAISTPGAARLTAAEILERMTPRANSIWTYGSQTADSLAQMAAKAIVEFLGDGDFFHIERHSELQQALINKKVVSGDGMMTRPGSVRTASLNVTPPASKSTGSAPATSIPRAAPPTVTPKMGPPTATPSRVAAAPASSSSRVAALSPSTAINGLLANLSLSSLLTMMEMEKKTGELMVTGRAETVHLLLRQGRIVHAVADGLSVPLECQCGIEAVYYLMRWTEGAFEFTHKEVDVPDEINLATTGILMEAARRSDQAVRTA